MICLTAIFNFPVSLEKSENPPNQKWYGKKCHCKVQDVNQERRNFRTWKVKKRRGNSEFTEQPNPNHWVVLTGNKPKWGKGNRTTFRNNGPFWKCRLSSLGTKRQLVSPAVGVVGASPFWVRETTATACWHLLNRINLVKSNCSLLYQYGTILLWS